MESVRRRAVMIAAEMLEMEGYCASGDGRPCEFVGHNACRRCIACWLMRKAREEIKAEG